MYLTTNYITHSIDLFPLLRYNTHKNIDRKVQNTLRGKYPDGSLADFFIYHHGDFNNSWLMVLLIDALLSYFVKSKLVRLSIASIVTMAVFLGIESSNLPDVPAAFAGVVLYIAFSPRSDI